MHVMIQFTHCILLVLIFLIMFFSINHCLIQANDDDDDDDVDMIVMI